jgi:type I restriction enzyme S subunit
LKDHVTLINGYPFDSDGFNPTTGMPLIRIRDLLSGSTETFFDGEVPPAVIVRPGDLVVGMDGDFNAVTWSGEPAALNQRLCMLRPQPSLDRGFLGYLIPIPLKAINDVTYSTTVKHLSSLDLLAERIPLPPLSEQRVIAGFLDRETARIDELIAKKRIMLDQLEEHRQSFLAYTVLGATAERLGQSSSGLYGNKPEMWRETPLRHLGCQVQTGPFGSQLHAEEYIEDGWPVVNPMNIVDGQIERIASMTITDEKRDQLSRHILHEGDIVFGRRGEMGRAGLVTEDEVGWLCGTGSLRLRVGGDYLNPHYLKLLLETPPARAYFELSSVGSTMDNLNSEIVLAFPTLVPDLGEQISIVRAVEDMRQKTARLRTKLYAQIALSLEHRQALVTAAVTGEVDIPGVAA